MTPILVTGGAGFIGSHTCKALRAASFDPVSYDSLLRGNPEAVQWGALEIGALADGGRLREILTEDASYAPVNPYGASKMFCEQMLKDCAAAFPLRFVALRYFNAAGADPDGEIGECHVPETHA